VEQRVLRDAAAQHRAEAAAGAVHSAFARRPPAREAPAGYEIDEPAELERAARAARDRGGLRGRAAELGAEAGRSLRHAGVRALAKLVHGASNEQLERRFGNDFAQRAIFTGMARRFEPKFGQGFEGDIAYELVHHGNSRPPSRWAVRVQDDEAVVLRGLNGPPAITFRLSVPDFARLAAEEIDPQELRFAGRFSVEGDLNLATRVPEMFGAPPQF
jgi:hypothetical protein